MNNPNIGDIRKKIISVYLKPGELHIAEKPSEIHTVLGSCVSVTFYDAEKKIGAICHAQMPENKNFKFQCYDSCPHPCYTNVNSDFKFVTCSIKYMVKQFNKIGIMNNTIKARIIGGANMYESVDPENTIGQKNIAAARKMLKSYHIKLIQEDIGGNKARKLVYHSEKDDIEIKYC